MLSRAQNRQAGRHLSIPLSPAANIPIQMSTDNDLKQPFSIFPGSANIFEPFLHFTICGEIFLHNNNKETEHSRYIQCKYHRNAIIVCIIVKLIKPKIRESEIFIIHKPEAHFWRTMEAHCTGALDALQLRTAHRLLGTCNEAHYWSSVIVCNLCAVRSEHVVGKRDGRW